MNIITVRFCYEINGMINRMLEEIINIVVENGL